MISLPNYDAWKLATPPHYDPPPEPVSISPTGDCRCDAYTYPHSVGGGKCLVCPSCHIPDRECDCCACTRRRARQEYRRLRAAERKAS